MHKLIFLSLAFFVPCAVFLGIQTLLSAIVGGGSGDTFDPRGMGWQIAKTLFYGTIGLLFGLAIYLIFKSSGWISAYLALACTFVVQWHFATNGAIGPTEYFGFGDRIGAVQKKLKLNRSTLVKCSKDELGLVSDIKIDPKKSLITIAGEKGAITTDMAGHINSSMRHMSRDTTNIVTDATGKTFFHCRGSWGISPRLMNEDGTIIWKNKNEFDFESGGVDDSACGDFDGDGNLEIMIVPANADSVTLFYTTGTIKKQFKTNWLRRINLTQSSLGKPSILVAKDFEKYILFDMQGNTIREIKRSEDKNEEFESNLSRYPRNAQEECILEYNNNYFNFIGLDGTTLLKLKGPEYNNRNQLNRASAVPFRINGKEEDYLAILAYNSRGSTNRSVLSIYNHKKEIVYQEIFGENTYCLATKYNPETKTEILFVGGNNKVWSFTPQVVQN